MAYTSVPTYTVGQILTAANLNTYLRDNMAYLKGQAGAVQIESSSRWRGSASNSVQYLGRFTNPDATDSGGSAAGVVFEVEPNGFGKFAIVGERRGGYGRGRMHFLASAATTSADPDLSEAAITIDALNNRNVGVGTVAPLGKLHVYDGVDMVFRSGQLGVGTNNPQTKIHGYDSSSGAGCGFWGYNGLSTTIQVYPIGTVTGALTAVYTVIPSTGTTTAGVATGIGSIGIIPGASAQIYSSSPDFVNISVSAAGAVSVGRSGGSKTYKVALWFVWI